jgi:hypothetical protein
MIILSSWRLDLAPGPCTYLPILAPSGLSWPLLAHNGPSWSLLVPPGPSLTILAPLDPPAPSWPPLASHAFSWTLFATPDTSWPLLAPLAHPLSWVGCGHSIDIPRTGRNCFSARYGLVPCLYPPSWWVCSSYIVHKHRHQRVRDTTNRV